MLTTLIGIDLMREFAEKDEDEDDKKYNIGRLKEVCV
jgi:hypothetical protein